MTPDQRRRLHAILDQHDVIARELREGSEAVKAAIARSADTHEAIAKATTALVAANRAVVVLLNEPGGEEGGEGQP